MNKLYTVISLVILFLVSCRSSAPFFSRKTPHEQHQSKLLKHRLEKTLQGRQWLESSEAALRSPHEVQLPFSLYGAFHSDRQRALGLKFTARLGEKITVRISDLSSAEMNLFADLYHENGGKADHLLAADSSGGELTWDVSVQGNYLLRLQPEIFQTGKYRLTITAGPSLAFPVSGDRARIGSFWGDPRDGGRRRHEGIDIFASKGTPLLAAADGRITTVREGGLGGKTVWMRPSGKNFTIYYAHLDQQHVVPGQQVREGEIIGTVGNTGNARTTPPHLHFGIYTASGAVNPLAFVNRNTKAPPAIPQKPLPNFLSSRQKEGDRLVVPVAVISKGYLVELNDGMTAVFPFAELKTVTMPMSPGGEGFATM